jgi:hypothetical protein
MSAFCGFCRFIAETGDFVRIIEETFGVYFPYAIFAYQAWTYVLLLFIKFLRQSPSNQIGTLIAMGVEVHHPIPARQSKQPFEPLGCRR